jgi:hypothetical protein
MRKSLEAVFIVFLAVFQSVLSPAQAVPPKPPYTIDAFYKTIIVLWDATNITDDQVIVFAKNRGIAFDIDDIAPFKQQLIIADKTHNDTDRISKDITELVKVVLTVGATSVAQSSSGSATEKSAISTVDVAAKASAIQTAADLATDVVAKAKAASDADAAAMMASTNAAAHPDDTNAVSTKDTAAAAAATADQQAAIAKAASDAASTKALSSLTTNSNSGSLPFFVTAGAEFQNPYAISVNGSRASLTNVGNNTVAFVEFDYINRYAARTKDYADDTNLYNEWFGSQSKFLGGYLQAPWKHIPDYQADIGFVFDNGTSVTNQSYTAQTLAGGGDFYADFAFGLPLWRLNDVSTLHKVQVSIESSDGVVTEKNFEELHPNAFVGLGLQSSISAVGLTNCLLSARVGAGWLDTPEVQAGNLVKLDANNEPVFDFKPACEMSTYLLIPIGGVFLTVGANTYFGNGPPDSWNIKVGATIPFTAFKSILGQ